MDDKQIEKVKELVNNGCTIAWRGHSGREEYRIIKRVGMRFMDGVEGEEELGGIFENGEYIALDNVDPFEIVSLQVHNVFDDDGVSRLTFVL